jgi:hypothetical protein
MLDPAQLRAKMAIPANLKAAYQRIILAGMKVMFDNQTHNMMLQQLHQSPDTAKNLAEGIAGLMAILFKESNQTMPQQLIVPASIELLAHAIDFVTSAKLAAVTPEIAGMATQQTVDAVLHRFGVSPQQAQQVLQQMGQKGSAR